MKKLEWGQTPWDNYSREELLREVQRMYCALMANEGVIRAMKNSGEFPVFWGKSGYGGAAAEMTNQILKPLHRDYTEEGIFRAFFRTASSLLFQRNGFARMSGIWIICCVCRKYTEQQDDSHVGHQCGDPGCDGKLRLMTWDDMLPSKQA